MGRMFGTDGVRGVANTGLTPELAFSLGRAGAYVLTNERHKPRILIGRDTRISGSMLEAALIAGITSVGADVVSVGILPTPAVAYLTRYYCADAGVMISASHNPVQDNGIKFFDSHGLKLPDVMEDQIEKIIKEDIPLPRPTGIDIGRIIEVKNAQRDYMDFLKETIDVRFDGMKIALDCANGASSEIAYKLFTELGAEVHAVYNMPDGLNINRNCGSTHPEVISRVVVESGADVGLAFDGDADRIIAADERGNVIDGDRIMAVCALDMHARGALKKDTLVATIMSNMGLDMALKEAGCDIVKTGVGDRYVLERMLQDGYNLGGEQSGHIIFLDHNTTGDGMLSGLQLLAVMVRSGKGLCELSEAMQQVPQVLTGVRIDAAQRDAFKQDEEIAQAIKERELRLKDTGRIIIRLSGTEPLVRVMVEGLDAEVIETVAQELSDVIQAKYGA